MVKDKSRKIFSVLFCSFLFASCNLSYNEPVKYWFDYWTSTCQVGKIEYASENTLLNGETNLYANDPIEINLYTINPQKFALLKKTDNGRCFTFKNEDGDILSDYEETMVDPTWIKIRANLPDEWEGKKITLSGCLWPENRSSFSEDQLRSQSPELFYSTTFVQNTPPDDIMNLYVPSEYFPGTTMHYVSFDLPTENPNRNNGSSYEICYYLREDEILQKKGSKILHESDNKNTSGSNTFLYYFDEQEPNLNYEYTICITGPHGLKSRLFSTDPGLGVCVITQPTFTFGRNSNGFIDEDGCECIEVENDSDTVSYAVASADLGTTLVVELDSNPAGITGTLGLGPHTISATAKKDGCRDVTSTKKVRIVRTPKKATITTGKATNGKETDSAGYEYIEVDNGSDTVTYSITTEAGTTVDGTVDGTDFTGTQTGSDKTLAVGEHTLTAVVHKENCSDVTFTRMIKVVQKLQAPEYTSFTPARNGFTDAYGFEYVEVPDGTASGNYTLTAASGCTLVVKNSYGNVTTTTTSNSYYGTLVSLGSSDTYRNYTLTITVKKDFYTDQTYTKKIKLVKALQKPEIHFYKEAGCINEVCSSGTPECGEAYYLYDAYDVSVGTGGKLYYKVTAENGETVTLKDNDNEINSSSGELALGPHKLELSVSKTNYTPKSFPVDRVFVQGILDELTITSTNGEKTQDSGSGTSMSDPLVYRFSYLTDDSLMLEFTPGNSGNKVSWSVNGLDGTNTGLKQGIEYDRVVKLEIKQTREFCKSKTTTTYAKGIIKPITIKYHNDRVSGGRVGDAKICIGGIGGVGDFDLLGAILVNGKTVFSYSNNNLIAGDDEKYNVKNNEWVSLNGDTSKRYYEEIFTSPNDEITIKLDNLRRRRHTDQSFGTHEITKTLSDIKGVTIPTIYPHGSCTLTRPDGTENEWIIYTDKLIKKQDGETHYVYVYVKFDATESD